MNPMTEIRRLCNSTADRINNANEKNIKLDKSVIESAKKLCDNAIKWDVDSGAEMVAEALRKGGYL